MECLRCGNCCIQHPAFVNPSEIQRIISYLGISLDDWTRLYAGDGPGYHGFLPVRQINGACVFLAFDDKIASCKIHSVKPGCCVKWTPGPDKKECREGLEGLSALK